jgi:hypothetical protein
VAELDITMNKMSQSKKNLLKTSVATIVIIASVFASRTLAASRSGHVALKSATGLAGYYSTADGNELRVTRRKNGSYWFDINAIRRTINNSANLGYAGMLGNVTNGIAVLSPKGCPYANFASSFRDPK